MFVVSKNNKVVTGPNFIYLQIFKSDIQLFTLSLDRIDIFEPKQFLKRNQYFALLFVQSYVMSGQKHYLKQPQIIYLFLLYFKIFNILVMSCLRVCWSVNYFKFQTGVAQQVYNTSISKIFSKELQIQMYYQQQVENQFKILDTINVYILEQFLTIVTQCACGCECAVRLMRALEAQLILNRGKEEKQLRSAFNASIGSIVNFEPRQRGEIVAQCVQCEHWKHSQF
eukprot:TRINITY_DN4618_c0_g1_i5.p2 TRINITY_DN4618_c0_g1~~TRINITY_DN4618_c0_g1_i5.p2  ORF type:complete len:226 (-),score=-4.26 TRINITY_DN4618_c0_g1_i5:453-1130(-)